MRQSNGRYVNLIELTTGDLKIELTPNGKEYLIDELMYNSGSDQDKLRTFGLVNIDDIDATNPKIPFNYRTDESIFFELLEDLELSGQCMVYQGDTIALCGSIIIMFDLFDLDASKWTQDDKLTWQHADYWFYNLYAIRSYLDDMLQQGFVVWQNGKRYE